MPSQWPSRDIATQQPQQWRSIITQSICHADFKFARRSGFSGKLRRTELGALSLMEIASDFEFASRKRRHVVDDPNDDLVLVLVKGGNVEIEQRARTVSVGAGQFTIYELSAPFTYAHADPTDVIVVKLPKQLLSARVGKIGAVLGQSYFARTGIGRLTAEFLGGIARESNSLPRDAQAAFGNQVVDLVGLMLDCNGDQLPIAHSATKSALHRRCLTLIRSRLADPDLDPVSAAAAIGISPRYLHKVFQEAGRSFGAVLQDERLERSRRDLCDPGKATLSIGEVASRAGFRSQSHFSDSFRRKYGASPGAMRRAVKDGNG